MNPPWKDTRYTLIQWTCSYHKRRYRIRKTASMQWYNPRLWSYRKTWRNVAHPSDVSASRCRGSLVLATADRNRRLPLCWRAPSCRQKKTHNHLSVNQWLRSAIFAPQQHSSPIGFLFLKLPPPPCAVLLVIYNKAIVGNTSNKLGIPLRLSQTLILWSTGWLRTGSPAHGLW